MVDYDVIILGAGPAGLSAGIYTARNNLKTLILDIDSVGGKLNRYLTIENYPSFVGETTNLIDKLYKQTTDLGVEIEEFVQIDAVNLDKKEIWYNKKVISSKYIIIATGTVPRKLGIVGEEEYTGKGVSYCAVCDGPMFKDKSVAVIGGGNSALEEACFLTKFVDKVYLLHRRSEFRADSIIQDKVRNNTKIEILFNTIPVRIEGDNKVKRLIVDTNGINRVIFVDGVFPFIGLIPNTEMFRGKYMAFMNNDGFIVTNDDLETSMNGVFAVGDVRNTKLRQVVTAVADGALAGYMCTIGEK